MDLGPVPWACAREGLALLLDTIAIHNMKIIFLNIQFSIMNEGSRCVHLLSPPNIAKAGEMDTSYLIYEDDSSIVIPYPGPSASGVGALLAPFQTNVLLLYACIHYISQVNIFLNSLGLDCFHYHGHIGTCCHLVQRRDGHDSRKAFVVHSAFHEWLLFIPRNHN